MQKAQFPLTAASSLLNSHWCDLTMANSDPSHRKIYTPEQIQLYYDRIQLPHSYRNEIDSQKARTQEGLKFLTVLKKYQLAAVPFENLELHYSFHHTITLDPDHLFEKIVGRQAGRGGYCMENNCLFGTVLRSLGYDVFSIGARVNTAIESVAANKNRKGPKYHGW